jgi:uncharacterized oxidoreductase
VRLSDRTILITGGSSGIGLALAHRLVGAGNVVVVTGRRAAALAEVRRALPSVVTVVSDVADPAQRASLANEVTARFPALDVVIHNAGIQRAVDLRRLEPWTRTREEIAINLEGPMHLSALLLPHLLARPSAAIVNVSSGLAFVPSAGVPIYSATKAALHSYTLSLRHQLRNTVVEVVEVVPPAVHSNLGGSHAFGAPTAEYADTVMAQLAEGRAEITYQFSADASQASRATLDAMFARLNS